LERERKRSQNARPSRHGVKSFAQASGAQRTEGKLCAAAGAGRTRAAEGNNRQEIFDAEIGWTPFQLSRKILARLLSMKLSSGLKLTKKHVVTF